MSIYIFNQAGTKLVHKNLLTTPEALPPAIAPYRKEVVVALEKRLSLREQQRS